MGGAYEGKAETYERIGHGLPLAQAQDVRPHVRFAEPCSAP